jgi:glycosyltransferase involved in cell wall biosynthesis
VKKVSVLIPIYNEAKTFEQLLSAVRSAPFCGLEKEIIIVDDGSTDGTREVLAQLQKSANGSESYHFHAKNMGKGAALRTALSYAAGDIIVIQDADLEYDPKEYDELVRLIIDHKADVVYGSRLTGGKPARQFKFLHLVGNKFLTLVTNILYDTTISDMETCYKAFRSDVIKNLNIRSNRFEFEPEITAKVLKRKHHLYEVPISYYGRDFDEGKKITWKDGIGALWALLYYRFFD